MTFSENKDLLPGGSVSASEVKKLNDKIDALQQTVTSVADSVSALSNEVNTSSLNVLNAVIDNATIGSETVSSADITDAEIESADITGADITNADITNAEIDEAEITSLTVTNEVAISVNSVSFTGQNIHVSDNIQTDKKLLGADVETTNAKFTNAEVTDLEIKGNTTVRGDVVFPENGDVIYGEYLEVDANKVKVKSLTTETPSGSNNLVGYDANGNLIPVDASQDPAVLWQDKSGDITTIVPKNNKKVEATEITTPTLNADDVNVNDDLSVGGDTAITGTLSVSDDATLDDVSAQAITADSLTVTTDADIDGDFNVDGDTTLDGTTIDGTLQVNGDIIQNGSAYETHAEKVYTKDDLIITRDGAVSALSQGDFTGIQAKKYDGTHDGQLVFDNTGEARVGDVGDTEPLMTRDELSNMTDARPLVWDATNKRAICGSSSQADALNSGITSSDVTQIGDNETAIGDLSSLTTTDKTDLVSAINEVSASIGTPDVSNVTGVLPIANGGTGASTKSVAKTNLGNYSGYIQGDNFNSSSITLTMATPSGANNITEGDTVTVYILNDVKSSVAVNEVSFSFAGRTEYIDCKGTLIKSHEYTSANANYNASYPHVVFKAGTTLTLMYDEDGRWHIIGNPEVDSYHDANGNGYVIKADGLIRQWGVCSWDSSNNQMLTFAVSMADSNYTAIPVLDNTAYTDRTRGFIYNCFEKGTSSYKFVACMTNSSGIKTYYDGQCKVMVEGY